MIIIYAHHGREAIERILPYMTSNPQVYRSRSHNWNPSTPPTGQTCVSYGCVADTQSNIRFNSGKAIALASDKAKSRIVLYNNKVSVPEPGTETYPCVGRSRSHRGGRGFWYCKDIKDVEQAVKEGAVYFSKYIEKTNEYRVHVTSGRILAVSEKIPPEDNPDARSNYIWNNALNGFRFVNVRYGDWNPRMLALAESAVKTLGLDFGAVDILYDGINNKHYVCEVNTGPNIGTNYLARLYAEYFDWLSTKTTKPYLSPSNSLSTKEWFMRRQIKPEDY